jgi:hypothetical protein
MCEGIFLNCKYQDQRHDGVAGKAAEGAPLLRTQTEEFAGRENSVRSSSQH